MPSAFIAKILSLTGEWRASLLLLSSQCQSAHGWSA